MICHLVIGARCNHIADDVELEFTKPRKLWIPLTRIAAAAATAADALLLVLWDVDDHGRGSQAGGGPGRTRPGLLYYSMSLLTSPTGDKHQLHISRRAQRQTFQTVAATAADSECWCWCPGGYLVIVVIFLVFVFFLAKNYIFIFS